MNRNEQGYSLIEMMLVITIVAMVSAGGLYGWQRWQQQQRLWQTACQLRDYLEQLREDANWHNRDHKLWLKREGQTWCTGSEAEQEKTCKPGDKRQFSPRWSKVTVAEITPDLAFYGMRNTAWPGHILLSSPAGEWRITVSVWGRIRLCPAGGSASCQ